MTRIILTFLLGAFIGGGLMGWALEDMTRRTTRNIDRALVAVEDSRKTNQACGEAYQDLWARIAEGRKIELRRAARDNQQWGGK